MSDTKLAKLEEQLTNAQNDIEELRSVVSKLSREKNEIATTVGNLNRDCANNRDSVKALQQWAGDQNDQTGRKSYASTSRY